MQSPGFRGIDSILFLSLMLRYCRFILLTNIYKNYVIRKEKMKRERSEGERKANKGKGDERTWVTGRKITPVHDVLRSGWWLRS